MNQARPARPVADVADGRRWWVAVGAWWAIARATGRPELKGALPPKWWEIQEVSDALGHYLQAS